MDSCYHMYLSSSDIIVIMQYFPFMYDFFEIES